MVVVEVVMADVPVEFKIGCEMLLKLNKGYDLTCTVELADKRFIVSALGPFQQ